MHNLTACCLHTHVSPAACCCPLLQGEGAAGWYSDHLVVAEALVNSLAEKLSAPLQVRVWQQQAKRHTVPHAQAPHATFSSSDTAAGTRPAASQLNFPCCNKHGVLLSSATRLLSVRLLLAVVHCCCCCCQVLATFKGSCLEGCHYQHPLCERVSPLVLGGDYITTDSGTGLVHTAPGHGQEDYQVGAWGGGRGG
jgi:hypothetical protein